MIFGLDWTNIYSDVDKDEIIVRLENAGFRWADTEKTDPQGARKTSFVGDDMIIFDVDEKTMWTGDWGTYVDVEVDLNYVRFLDHKRFDD